jgi:hypothetical protein
MPKGKNLRIQCLHPAIIKWTRDNWATSEEIRTLDSGIGVHFADLKTLHLDHASQVSFTFYWTEAECWENINYSLSVDPDPSLVKDVEGPNNPDTGDKPKMWLPS